MIRRLRLKFVCINMAIVTLMLCAIFAMVFFFTRANLERESIGVMQALAQEPMRPGGPDERPEGVRLPFFTLELDEDGGIADAWGGYYDLTDGELLEKLLALAEAGDGNTACWRTTACAIAGSGREGRSTSSLRTCPASGASSLTS